MAIKDMLQEINADVKDILQMGFELTQTQGDYVPSYEDPGLTFETGQVKRAKLIETCVLYADIRNSTTLSRTKSKDVMGRLYTAFVKSILNIAEYHGGVIRNIIGDRVMVVFPQNNCFTNAVDTAVSINTVASRIIDRHFNGFDFKCGIGIDHGEMKIIKAGIPKQDKERTNYKNLVWIGNAANIASKLTDVANKKITKNIFRVTRNPSNPKAWRNILPIASSLYSLGLKPRGIGSVNFERVQGEPEYLNTTETVDLSPEEFAKTIYQSADGSISTLQGKMLKFEKKEIEIDTQPILISQKVWEEFKRINQTRHSVVNKYWTQQNIDIKEYSGQIFGGSIYWNAVDEIII